MPQYRKISADNIFNGNALTGPGHVIITDESGRIEALLPADEAGEGVEFFNGIISPGFINTHCHTELSHMKNRIPQQTGLVDFVQSVMKDRAAAEEEKQQAMAEAMKELYNSGTSAVGDICNTADSIPLKKNSDLYWHDFIEVSGFTEAGAEKRFKEAEALRQKFKQELPGSAAAVSPHAPYSVSKKLFGLINDATAGQTITIHNQETEAETELYQTGGGKFLELYNNFGIDISSFVHTGKSSFESWLPFFNKEQKIICVHNTFTQQTDLNSTLINKNVQLFFALCAQANLYIENKLPPVELLMKNNMKITLGTDSYASNTALNIFEEIKTIRRHFPSVATETILQWATSNGAEALNMNDRLGAIKKGMRPGLVLIDPVFEKAERING